MLRRIPQAFFALLFATPLCWSRLLTVPQVQIQLHVEQEQIRAEVTTASDYWISEILSMSNLPPPTHWPELLQNMSKSEIEKSFSLLVDGTLLELTSLDCRYVEEPFQLSASKVQFVVTYKLPKGGAVLAGRALFFEGKYSGRDIPVILSLSGKDRQRIRLNVGNSNFTFALQNVQKTSFEYAQDSFWFSFSRFFSTFLFSLICLVGFIAQKNMGRREFLFFWGTVFALAATLFLGLFSSSWKMSEFTCWVGLTLAIASLLFYSAWPKFKDIMLMGSFVYILVVLCENQVKQLSFSLENSSLIQPSFFLGVVAAAFVFLISLQICFVLYRRHLRANFRDLADRFLVSDLKALCGFLFFICFMQLVKSFL